VQAVWWLPIALTSVVCLSCERRPHPATHFPITSGRPTELSPRGAILHVIGVEGQVKRSAVTWLQHLGDRVMQGAGADAAILCEILDPPAIWAGVTREVIIRLQRPPGGLL
jgi:hypothetical protein